MVVFSNRSRGLNPAFIFLAAIIVTCVLAYHRYFHPIDSRLPIFSKSSSSLTDVLQALYAPLKHPINVPFYTDASGIRFDAPLNPIWKTSLDKDILIVDIDTRDPYKDGILGSSPVVWEDLGDDQIVSQGILNHYVYAQIHGYAYAFIRPEPLPNHHATWVKVPAISSLLSNPNGPRFVVFLDADVVVNHPEVPLEFLFNRWNINANTSIAMPLDVDRENCLTCDTKGKVMLNSGVIVAQRLERTREIFSAWSSCTGEGGTERYEGCGTWRYNWAHEQRAFSEYVRYEFDRPDDVREIACADANGYPEKPDFVLSQCNGDFFRHHWEKKWVAKKAIAGALMQNIVELVQRKLWETREEVIVDQTAHV